MVSSSLTNNLIRLSCVLSMVGSALIVFTWAYPKENRTKPGRILLLWLSVADFLSSLFYLIQTIGSVNETDGVCQALALLDIFFPVASFLWTDFIAYYLYLVVHYRSVHFVISWEILLRWFHVGAWSISLLVVLLVLLTDHAGHNTNDDDQADNTAGWCWIEASSKKERFVWELIGGKFIEWSSGLIVIPFFYISVARKLYDIDRKQLKTNSGNSDIHFTSKSNSFISDLPSESGDHGNLVLSNHEVRNVLNLPPAIPGLSSTNSEVNATNAQTDVGDSDYDMDHRSTGQSLGRMGYDDGSFYSSKGNLEYDGDQSERLSTSLTSVSIDEKGIDEDDENFEFSRRGIGGQPQVTGSAGKYFNRFYLKLFLLPLVFITIRFWSSLRILLAYFDEGNYSNNNFLLVMQAFFDPSQGFFNSILFVFFSKNDRNRLYLTLQNFTKRIISCCFPQKASPLSETNIRLENIVRNQRDNTTRNLNEGTSSGRPSVVGGVGVNLPSSLQENLVKSEFTTNPMNPNAVEKAVPKKGKKKSLQKTNRHSEDDYGSEIALEDLEDFECNADDRMSDFSFDSRMESQSTTANQAPYNFD